MNKNIPTARRMKPSLAPFQLSRVLNRTFSSLIFNLKHIVLLIVLFCGLSLLMTLFAAPILSNKLAEPAYWIIVTLIIFSGISLLSLICIIYFLVVQIGGILIVPGIIVALGWAVAGPVYLHENITLFGSFGRSWELTDGYKL